MADYILAIDQGTTGTTALVLDTRAQGHGRETVPVPQDFPAPRQVELDGDEALEQRFAQRADTGDRSNAQDKTGEKDAKARQALLQLPAREAQCEGPRNSSSKTPAPAHSPPPQAL